VVPFGREILARLVSDKTHQLLTTDDNPQTTNNKPNMKSSQNYQNHRRWVPAFHFVTLPLVIVLVIASFVNLYRSVDSDPFSALLICMGSLIMGSLYAYTRIFSLKVQSRVIRAEENFRHYVLTGKPLDTRLRLSQIIALRFAKDDEFVELAKKAVDEKLSNDAIKSLITDWRADYHRV